MYETTQNDKNQMNNYAKTCQRKLAYKPECHHSTQKKFLETLNKVENGEDLYMEHLIARHDSDHKLKEYPNVDKRIKTFIGKYDA